MLRAHSLHSSRLRFSQSSNFCTHKRHEHVAENAVCGKSTSRGLMPALAHFVLAGPGCVPALIAGVQLIVDLDVKITLVFVIGSVGEEA